VKSRDGCESNPFNMVDVVTEPAAARKLKRAPNVDSVSPAGEVASISH
jgi:hypothetical protein